LTFNQRHKRYCWWAITFFLCGCSSGSDPISFSIEEQSGGVASLIVGISIVDESQIWMSGVNSTVLQSIDGGQSWDQFHHPKIDTFQFRDIHAFDENTVIVLASGEGENSQIIKFDKGLGWFTQFQMPEEKGFLNSIAFWDEENGLAYGDSFDGKPYILKTENGGNVWERVAPENLPEAPEGEGGFASSGSCIDVGIGGDAWVGTGAGGSARVLTTNDYGDSWKSHESPMVKGDFAGITSIHFRSLKNGMIAGGDLTNSDGFTDNIAFSADAGRTWSLASKPYTAGAFYGSDFIRLKRRNLAIVGGPNGADISLDGGESWQNILSENIWVVDLHASGVGWLAGQKGKIFKVTFR